MKRSSLVSLATFILLDSLRLLSYSIYLTILFLRNIVITDESLESELDFKLKTRSSIHFTLFYQSPRKTVIHVCKSLLSLAPEFSTLIQFIIQSYSPAVIITVSVAASI